MPYLTPLSELTALCEKRVLGRLALPCPNLHAKRQQDDQRWKSQRIKIHRLAYRFSLDFYIQTLEYGILFGNHKYLAKVSRLFRVRGFEIFKIQWLV
jgi:hypothetical protein